MLATALVLAALPQHVEPPKPPAAPARVAAYYFYWYRFPYEHFPASGRRNGHFHHFKDPQVVSYLDPDWHEGELRAMAACGIDIVLPVYWGAPGAYDRPGMSFSVRGLPPMLEALGRLRKQGVELRVGMFYDTTTLRGDVRGAADKGRPDLRSGAGKAVFQRTVLEYFERIPRQHWATIDGRALVVLYSAQYARAWDRTLGPELRRAFREEFEGADCLLIAEASWRDCGQDFTTGWGSTIYGPQIHGPVVQLGPGFDDSPVRGPRQSFTDRQDGDFYRWSWRRAILARPRLVILETWNEMHEGTEICETRETGRKYLEITKEYTARLRRGDPGPEIAIRRPFHRARPDHSWGADAKGKASAHADYTGETPVRFGLREVSTADGPLRVDSHSLRPFGGRPGGTYIHFQVADLFRFEVDETLVLIVDVDRANPRRLALQYDSHDQAAPQNGTFRRVEPEVSDLDAATQRLTFTLPRARCANRQPGRSDFRLEIGEARTVIRRVEVRAGAAK